MLNPVNCENHCPLKSYFCPRNPSDCVWLQKEQPSESSISLFKRGNEDFAKVKKSVSDIVKALNIMGNDDLVANATASAVINEHRTNQQALMDVFVRGIVDVFALMGDKGMTDLRNEGACSLAQKLKKVMDENPLSRV